MTVIKNKRGISSLEFYHNATLARAELTRLVMNERIVPKRWRPVFAFPMIEKFVKLFDCITAANTIYPQSLHEAETRRDYQTEAIITVEQILQFLEYLLDTLPINPNVLQPLTAMLLREEDLLKGWRKSDNKFLDKFRK